MTMRPIPGGDGGRSILFSFLSILLALISVFSFLIGNQIGAIFMILSSILMELWARGD